MRLEKYEFEAVQYVKEFIHTCFNERITISKMSVKSKLTPIRLQHAFKNLYGTSIYAYITSLRMEHAAGLLTGSDLSIKEIASKVGYRRTKKFSPMFKSCYGSTPSAYRKNYH